MPIHVEPEQINAALRLFDRLGGWKLAEQALNQLRDLLPRDFSEAACLLKTVTINELYATQILATSKMAKRVHGVLANAGAARRDPELVEELAVLDFNREKRRMFTSFASKFCHFFLDAEAFPIFDDAAREALKFHLGKDMHWDDDHRYRSFCEGLSVMRAHSKLSTGARDLDRYLWLVGMYLRWLKQRHKEHPLINEELLRLFKSQDKETILDLEGLLPQSIERTFR